MEKKRTVERLAYSVPEAAEALGVCAKTLRKLMRRGKLRGRLVGLRVRIPAQELRRFLAAR